MTNTMTKDDKNIKSSLVDSDGAREVAKRSIFLEGMDKEQRCLFKRFLLTTGNLKNNFDQFHDMQIRLRKAILALPSPKTSSSHRKVKVKRKIRIKMDLEAGLEYNPFVS